MFDHKHCNLPKGRFPLCQEPVFVVGAARSGTTWIQCLISAHPDFISCAETHFFDLLLYPGVLCGGYQLHRPKRILRNKYLTPFQLQRSFQQAEKTFIHVSKEIQNNLMEQARLGTLSPGDYLNTIMYACGNVIDADKRRWVEKTPIHINYLEDIFHWFSKAKVVCVIRDPKDVVLSAHTSVQAPFIMALRDYIRSYQKIEAFFTKFPNRRDSVYFIYYEDIKKQPSPLTKLFEFLGVAVPEIPDILAEAQKQFQRLYAGTTLESIQPQMKKPVSGVTELNSSLGKMDLKVIIEHLLPSNQLWKHYLDKEIYTNRTTFVFRFRFLLKKRIEASIYVLLRRGLWIYRSFCFYLKGLFGAG